MLRFAHALTLTLAVSAAFTLLHAQTASAAPGDELETSARGFVTLIVQGEFSEAAARFDETMKAALPAEKLKATWESLLAQVGAFEEQGGIRAEKVQIYDVVLITCRFEQTSLDVKIVLNPERKVAGLFFLPVAAPPAGKAQQPTNVNQEAFSEVEVVVGDGEWALPGILSLPKTEGASAAVVLVHGSGPNDRDETVGANKPFRDLAWGLASQGIAVLRYDKRTLVHGKKLLPLMDNFTVQTETIDDALAAARLLRDHAGVREDAVFVLGHSLGGMLIPRIAAQDPDLAGFIILAGLARPLHEVLPAQVEYIALLDGELSESEKQQLEETKAAVARIGALRPDEEPSGDASILGGSRSYWLDLQDYRPHEEARNIKQPMLILQGGRDYQVTTEDLALWKASLGTRDTVGFKLYADLNHLFIAGKGDSSPQEYQTPGNVASEVIDDMAAWILSDVESTSIKTAGP